MKIIKKLLYINLYYILTKTVMKQKVNISIEIENINIDYEELYKWYYNFDYIITINWKEIKKEKYYWDFSGQGWREIKTKLENWLAIELILTELAEHYYNHND